MLLPVALFAGRFWIARFPMPQNEMRKICEFTNDGCNEKLVSTYALFAFDVLKDHIHTFRVETNTNALYDVKWSENVDDGEDGNEYKIDVYKRLREWFYQEEKGCLGVDLKNPTEYLLWKGKNAL